MANKPVPFHSPQSMVQSLLGLVPSGTSVSVSVPVSADRNFQVSVGITPNLSAPPAARPAVEPYRQLAMEEETAYPVHYWQQQRAVD